MKKDVIFVLTEGFADWESAFLSSIISNGGFEKSEIKYNVKTIAALKKPVVSFGGFNVLPDYNSLPDEYAALILLGSKTWKRESVSWVKPLVEDALKKDTIIGAICDACLYLAMNGFLNNIEHTGNDLDEFNKYAKNYTGEIFYKTIQAACAGKIVTANGTAYLEFTKEILKLLKVDSDVNIERFYKLYKYGQYPI